LASSFFDKVHSGNVMKSLKDGYGYNERLFSGVGLRSKLHFSRFKWFLAAVTKLNCPIDSVLELGCFDGKLINFLPSKPLRYIGFDANWEGGLDIAKTKWADSPNFSFLPASSPEDMDCLNNKDIFNIAVAMETLEHVPLQLVDGSLRKIAQHLDGYFFVTVPNEKGFLFLTKWLIKKSFTKDATHYSLSELANATLGRMDLVDRHEHKGFDYSSLIKEMEKYFDVIEVSGFPFGVLPNSFYFGIGIIAKSKESIS
jgi:2-polyprenyl-3-methyl-5-hydroxy-6-metoxy-1,4-benzoquinol methylase